MRQTLRTMAQQIAAANPKMKGSQLFGAMQQELELMKGVEPATKDAMTQYIEAQKLNAKYAGLAQTFQVGLQKIQGAKDIASMQAATKEMIEKAHEQFGIEVQGMKDTTAESVEGQRAAAGEAEAGTRAAATTGAAKIRGDAELGSSTIRAGATTGAAQTRADSARDVAKTGASARGRAAGIAAGQRVKAPPGVAKLPDGTRLQKDGQTWVKQGDYVVPE